MEDQNSPREYVRPHDLATATFYQLLTSCVVPRPIAWVSTRDSDGVINLAPYSLFTVVSSEPPIVLFIALQREKDSVHNARESGEFTVNVTSYSQREQVNATSETLPLSVDEAALAGVPMEAGIEVSCPRVADSVISIECRTHHIEELGNGFLVFGEVLGVVAKEGAIGQSHLVAPDTIDVLGKLAGPIWAGLREPVVIPRPDASGATHKRMS